MAVIAYAEDALDWHHHGTGASPTRRAAERRAVARWRLENPLDVSQGMRLLGSTPAAEIPESDHGDRSSLPELCERPGLLIQYSREEIASLRQEWHAGEDYASPTFERHADDAKPGDVVIFWQMGPKDTAGVAAVGIIDDTDAEWLAHARSYQDPAGRRSLRRTQEVQLIEVFYDVHVSRPELKSRPEFSNEPFELFVCPNRPNAFRIERAQLRYILETLNSAAKAA